MPTATSSAQFILRHPTADELIKIRTHHAACWAGPLTIAQYLSREAHIASTPLTRDGGITQWVLVSPDSLEILATCESIRKIAAISHPSVNSERTVPVKEVVAHGIGSVFTPPHCRGNGYARVMLTMLGERLKCHNGEVAGFSALYSDIGKEFYAKLGWLPHRSCHIDIPVPTTLTRTPDGISQVDPVYHSDIPALCALDIAAIKISLSTCGPKLRLAFIPDHNTLDWHHNREEFIASCVRPSSGIPKVKGSVTRDGRRWIIWSRDFSLADPKLYILRVVDLGGDERRGADMDAMLWAAVEEAAAWGLKKVCVWNPSQALVDSAKRILGKELQVEDREMDSIASLMMYGEEKVGSAVEDVEWVINEKFAWC